MQLVFPDLEIDLDSRRVTRAGTTAHLTEREAEALRYLAQRAGEVVARERLERDVWRFRSGVRSEAVPMAIRRLRAKIESDPDLPSVLLTVHGRGWRLCRPEPASARVGPPGFPTPFLPRPAHEEAIGRWLDSGHRLVTLVGPGGAGKTRLAAAVGALRPPCAFVDLEGCTTEAQVCAAVGRAVGLRSALDPRDLPPLLDDEGLVVLDNAEDATVAHLVVASLARATATRFLVTSRVPLGVTGEVAHEVGGMDEPEALELLSARLAAIGAPPLPPLRALEVVRALDGLPLALELGASPLSRLAEDAPLGPLIAEVVEAQAADRTPRHQSVAATLSWSWSQLSASERDALLGCTLFASEFDAPSVSRVVGPGAEARLETLRRLWLVQRRGERYRLLPAVRTFLARMAPRPDQIEAHGRWVADEARELLDAFVSDPVRACERASTWRADLERAVERADPESAAMAALCLSRWCLFDGGPPESGIGLERVIERPLPPYLRTRVVLAQTTHALNLGRWAEMDAILEALGDDATPLPWEDLEVIRGTVLCRCAVHRTDLPDARRRITEAVARARRNDLQKLLVDALLLAGAVEDLDGDTALADLCWAEGLSVARRIGYPAQVPRLLTSRGRSLSAMGESARGRALLEEAVEAALAVRRSHLAVTALHALHDEHMVEDPSRAAAYLARAADLAPPGALRIIVHFVLGMSRYLAGDVEGAFEAVHPHTGEIDRVPQPWAEQARLSLATVLAAWGDLAAARHQFHALDPIRLRTAYSGAAAAEVDLLVALLESELDLALAGRGDREAQARADRRLESTEAWLATNDSRLTLLRALVTQRRARSTAREQRKRP